MQITPWSKTHTKTSNNLSCHTYFLIITGLCWGNWGLLDHHNSGINILSDFYSSYRSRLCPQVMQHSETKTHPKFLVSLQGKRVFSIRKAVYSSVFNGSAAMQMLFDQLTFRLTYQYFLVCKMHFCFVKHIQKKNPPSKLPSSLSWKKSTGKFTVNRLNENKSHPEVTLLKCTIFTQTIHKYI